MTKNFNYEDLASIENLKIELVIITQNNTANIGLAFWNYSN